MLTMQSVPFTDLAHPSTPPQSSMESKRGLFIVGNDGQVNYCNSQLEELIGVRLAQIVGHSYVLLIRELATISSNEIKTTQDLLAAVSTLTEQASVIFQVREPLAGRIQVDIFPIYGRDNDRPIHLGWGGLVSDAAAERQSFSTGPDHFSMLTQSLRGSVATIKGFVTTVLSGHRYWDDTERQKFLENIDEQVDQLGRLLQNAQEIFRFASNAVELDRRQTDIKRLLHRLVQHLTSQSYVLNLEISDDLPPLEIDALRIEQVIHNLLDYAARFSHRDKKFRLTAQLKDGAVQIGIADQDSRIPLEELTRIFDGQNIDLTSGTGIGLYVARGVVAAHGGQMWADNATLYFTLPLTPPQPVPPIQTKPIPIVPPSNTKLDIRPNREVAKVLVVDDDPQMLRLLKIKLEAEGFNLITATRGNNALELIVAEQPDVILLDVTLPDSNGFDVCHRLREFTSVPVIMITGQSREEDMVRGLDAGADDYLVKPVRNKELLARVRANLRRARVPDQTPSKSIFQVGDLVIDFPQRQVTVRSQPVRLTPTEYKLLYHLATNAGRILTHSQLLSKVWGPGYEDDTQYLWVNISRLRGKLEADPSNPEYILTESGVGYYFPDSHKADQ